MKITGKRLNGLRVAIPRRNGRQAIDRAMGLYAEIAISQRISAVAYRHCLSNDDHLRLRGLIKRRVQRSSLSFSHVVGIAEGCGDIRALMEDLERGNVRATKAIMGRRTR